jgi:hypothetical protein
MSVLSLCHFLDSIEADYSSEEMDLLRGMKQSCSILLTAQADALVEHFDTLPFLELLQDAANNTTKEHRVAYIAIHSDWQNSVFHAVDYVLKNHMSPFQFILNRVSEPAKGHAALSEAFNKSGIWSHLYNR